MHRQSAQYHLRNLCRWRMVIVLNGGNGQMSLEQCVCNGQRSKARASVNELQESPQLICLVGDGLIGPAWGERKFGTDPLSSSIATCKPIHIERK